MTGPTSDASFPEGARPLQITSDTSDGYHTFRELYEYRKAYNALLFNEWAAHGKYDVHKSWRHSDGELCFGGGWFVVVAQTASGQISNHYKTGEWHLFRVPERERGNEWDGHTPQVALNRLLTEATLSPLQETTDPPKVEGAAPLSWRQRIERAIATQEGYARGDTPCADVWKDRPGQMGHAHTAAVLRLMLQAHDYAELSRQETTDPRIAAIARCHVSYWTNDDARYVLDAVASLKAELDALRAAQEAPESIDDALDIYVPGRWRCLKCGFVLSQVTLFVATGEAGHTREQVMGEHREACPNDGELMTRVTWREDAKESQDYAMKLIDDVLKATGAESLPAALDQMLAAAPEKGGQ